MVGREDYPIVPPLGINGSPLEGMVRVIALWLTGQEILVKGNHVHVCVEGGGGGAVEEVSGGVASCSRRGRT